MDLHELIDRAGGVGKFAEKIGVDHSTVSGWKKAGRIPGIRVPQISEVFGVAPDLLIRMVRGPARGVPASEEMAVPSEAV